MSFEIFKQYIDNNDLTGATAAISQLRPEEIQLDLPFYYAAKIGNSSFLNLFLELNADPFVYQEAGKDLGLTPIHIATMKNRLEVVKTLLLHSYDLLECETDENFHNSTPINLAADLDSPEMLEFYLLAGADINKRDLRGHFPLWKTVRKGNLKSAEVILEKAAAVIIDLADNSGITSLQAACTAGEITLSKLLLDYGASPNVQDQNGDTALHHATQIQVQRLIFKYNLGLTESHTEILYMLVVWSDVDITIKNNEGDAAFDVIEIACADLFDLAFKHKMWLRQKKIKSFQKLLKLRETLKATTESTFEICDLLDGIDAYIAFVDELNSNNSSGACVLINSAKTPYKRKFLHLFKDGKLITPDAIEPKKGKCPFGFTGAGGTPQSGEPIGDALCSNEASDVDAPIGVCPVTGQRGPMPAHHAPIPQTVTNAPVCPMKNPALVHPTMESNGKPKPEQVAMPQGHPTVSSHGVVCPITGMGHGGVKPTAPKIKSDSASCPFSENFVPTEEDDKLPECTQQ